MINKKLLTLIFVSTISLSAYANDTSVEGIGGSFHVMKQEHNAVSMVSENIFMDIYPQYYDVKAEFTFKNTLNKSVTVQMGFPEDAYGDINSKHLKDKSGFLKFKTSVKGRLTRVSKRQVMSANEETVSAYWIKEVKFAPMEQLKVIAEYRSKIGITAMPTIFAEYEFTGGNWKGKVRESNLTATLHLPTNYSLFKEYDSSSKDIVQKGNKIYFSHKNWEADYNFRLSFKPN